MVNKKVSVVIPTLNSDETIEDCLASVKVNNSKYDYEIIVADAGSTDGTIQTAKKYTDKVINGLPLRINRNKGVEQAEGNIICFTDSDCVVPQNWINELVDGLLRLNKMDNRMVGVGGGNIPPVDNLSFTELVVSKAIRSPLISFRARNVSLYKDEREVMHNPPVNSAYFKSVIEEVGGFAEENIVGEDVELDAKLIERGYKLYYLPNILVYHKHRSSFKKFIKQMYEFGKHRIRVGRKYKRYLELHHYGPIALCIMTFSPLFVVPLAIGVANATYVSIKERNALIFWPLVALTMSFYVSYGAGEIAQLFTRGK